MPRLFPPSVLTSLILLFCSPANAQADRDNYIQLYITANPDFELNTTALLESPQTIANAFYIAVASKRNHATVYAAIPSNITSATATPMPVSTISLRYNHTTCPGGQQMSIRSSDIAMNTTPTFLFQQGKKNKLIAYWYYDIKIPAIGYNYAPGSYHFTIQFTITQP